VKREASVPSGLEWLSAPREKCASIVIDCFTPTADCSEYCFHSVILAFLIGLAAGMVDEEVLQVPVQLGALARKLDRIKENSIHILPSLVVYL
jgi:2-keto-3-deoxy-galactonokinase